MLCPLGHPFCLPPPFTDTFGKWPKNDGNFWPFLVKDNAEEEEGHRSGHVMMPAAQMIGWVGDGDDKWPWPTGWSSTKGREILG